MDVFLISLGFVAILVGSALLAGFPGYLIALGFGFMVLGFFDSIELSLRRLAKRWAP